MPESFALILKKWTIFIRLTNHRWIYLATVFDPEKRKVLGYKIGDTMTAKVATSALQMELNKHQKQLIVHSDMGSQYTSAEFNIEAWGSLLAGIPNNN
ncbi:DDE-type integrase/transposase/recombinase [Leuconostoc lactis]|uniref:DDE-type integrase/transposase/recombinase n=1 Tax=Leuconostoc lactis TaxID=1246 RepID=UPI002FE1F00D